MPMPTICYSLYANGCQAKIIATGTKSLFEIMAADSAFIMSRDIEQIKTKMW